MGLSWFPPWMSHKPMFQISAQSIEEIQNYWYASAGYWIWVLMVVSENDLECFLMFSFNYIVNLEFPFTYPIVYKPLILTLWASFSPFSFGESERSLEMRAYLSFWEERGFNFDFSSFSIPSKFFEWENLSKYGNSNISFTFTFFLNSKHFFTILQNFSFIELHETNSSTLDCIHTFSSESHEIHLAFDWNIYLHDSTLKSHLMESCSNFQFLVKFSPSTHEIGCSSCLSSLWVLAFSQLRFAWKVVNKYKQLPDLQDPT